MAIRLLACVLAVCAATVADARAGAASRCADGYVGLTFDVGPTRATPGLVDRQRRHGLRATMFNIAERAHARPDAVRARVEAGMWVGNHTISHPVLAGLRGTEIAAEIGGAQAAPAGITGRLPTLFRPPLMLTGRRVRRQERRLGLTEVLATVDTRGYAGATLGEIVRAVRTVRPGGIVLMHDYVRATRRAIPRIGGRCGASGCVRAGSAPPRATCAQPTARWSSTPSPSAPEP